MFAVRQKGANSSQVRFEHTFPHLSWKQNRPSLCANRCCRELCVVCRSSYVITKCVQTDGKPRTAVVPKNFPADPQKS